MIDILELLSGRDIVVKELNLKFHQPTLNEVSLLGEQVFRTILRLCCADTDSLFKQASLKLQTEMSNIELLYVYTKKEDVSGLSSKIKIFFNILFPDYTVTFNEHDIFLLHDKTLVRINQTNYEIFNKTLQEICGYDNSLNQSSPKYNPANKQAASIAEKLRKGQEKADSQKSSTASQNFFARFASILSVGLGINLNEIMEYTLFQFYDITLRFQYHFSFSIELQMSALGATPKNKEEEKDKKSFMDDIHM